MKKLVGIIIILFTNTVLADLPTIVAKVNGEPITKFDFIDRKKLMIELSNIDISKPQQESRLNQEILNQLIMELLVQQHYAERNQIVTETDVDNAIANIEKTRNIPKGGLQKHFQDKGINIETFKKQIYNQLIQNHLHQSNIQNDSISEHELLLLPEVQNNLKIEAWLFTDQNKISNTKSLHKMKKLKKDITSCKNMSNKLYNNIATATKLNAKIIDIPKNIQSIILDTPVNSSSNIYKEKGQFRFIFVCKKDNKIPLKTLDQIKSTIKQKKSIELIHKFLLDLKLKAYIEKMI